MIVSCYNIPRTNPTGRGVQPRELLFRCDTCSIEFTKRYAAEHMKKEQHFCSWKCQYAHRKMKMFSERVCPQCGKIEILQNSIVKNIKYCSQVCYGKWRSDHADELGLRTLLNRPNIRAKSTQTIRELYATGIIQSPMTGKHHTKESRIKISEHHLRTGCLKGVKNGMYGRKHAEQSKEQMSDTCSLLIAEGKRKAYGKNRHKSGKFISSKCTRQAWFRSSWEHAFLKHLENDDKVMKFTHEPFRIQYIVDNHTRWYIPDVIVEYADGTKILYEIKPVQFVNSKRCILKSEAAKIYCHENGIDGYQILTREDLVKLGVLT